VPLQPRAIDFVLYNVTDMERALAFYVGVLGLPIATRAGPHWTELAAGPDTLVLAVPPPEWAGPSGQIVALAVADVPAAVAEVRAQGATVLRDAWETDVCWMAVVADPDGNRLMLHQRKDGTAG
jgi:predicted enzyme related to lactoylglutathione lyase